MLKECNKLERESIEIELSVVDMNFIQLIKSIIGWKFVKHVQNVVCSSSLISVLHSTYLSDLVLFNVFAKKWPNEST